MTTLAQRPNYGKVQYSLQSMTMSIPKSTPDPIQKPPHKNTLIAKKTQQGRPPKPKPKTKQTNNCGLSLLIDMFVTLNNTNSSDTQSSNDEFSQPTQLNTKNDHPN